MFVLIFIVFFLVLPDAAFAQVDGAFVSDAVVLPKVHVQGTRIRLSRKANQEVHLTEEKTLTSRPTLDSALGSQNNIQIIPTPLRSSNLSLGGLSGEHVALFWNGDPILGRIDGALDTRSVGVDGVEKIAVYQGLDSLAYGSQNIAGVISLESAWNLWENTPNEFFSQRQSRYVFRAGAGSFSRTLMSAQGYFNLAQQSAPQKSLTAHLSVSNWKSDAVLKSDIGGIEEDTSGAQTLLDSSARISASALASKQGLGVLRGQEIDLRFGFDGFHENSKGIFASQLKDGSQQRMHLYSDLRRGKSFFHFGFSQYKNEVKGISQPNAIDQYSEQEFRFGPELQEKLSAFTFFAGTQLWIQQMRSSRIAQDKNQISRLSAGSHLGARYAFNDHVVFGVGSRYDSGPKFFSPRAELRFLFDGLSLEHSLVFETGLGFREVTSKEKYLDFVNASLRYRVVGNPSLQNERAWMSAIRYQASHKRLQFKSALFQVRVKDAIGYQPDLDVNRISTLTYSNIGQTLTHGYQLGIDYKMPKLWEFGWEYQFLRGQNLENQSALFLQPAHRVALRAGRQSRLGFSLLSQWVWTAKQGFFDSNRDRFLDAEEYAASYWMTNLEIAYGFRISGISELIKPFVRFDNVLNQVHPDTFPVEPRVFFTGAMVEL